MLPKMTNLIPCYWIEPAGRISQFLRRYSSSREGEYPCCGKYSYHNAYTKIGEVASTNDFEDKINRVSKMNSGVFLEYSKDHPAWPKKCSRCDYVFTDADNWQYTTKDIYRNPKTRVEHDLDEWGVGATWDCSFWLGSFYGDYAGPDGKNIQIRLPGRNNDWSPDRPSTKSGTPWSRIGDPEKDITTLTIRPSVRIGKIHAYITNGVIELLPDSQFDED